MRLVRIRPNALAVVLSLGAKIENFERPQARADETNIECLRPDQRGTGGAAAAPRKLEC